MEKAKLKKHASTQRPKGYIGYVKDKRDILKSVPKLRKVKKLK